MGEEQSLVAALKCRDPAAIDALIETHGTRLLRSATLLCGNETNAQDLVQDTFVEAFRSIHRFRGQASLYTWLHSILLNLTRHYRRKNNRLVYDNELATQEPVLSEEQPNALDLESATTELTRALRQLTSPHREVLVLRFYEHMKIDEIARHLGVSKGTVKSRLHYAIHEMQKLFPKEMNLFSVGGTNEKI
ncbi:MAG TPA: RNA polymerase sigma factor [Verrucomicrobiae bacterium]|nr:RNA polymerase sigma factor [Verrucomicrobiae bacterium]